MTSSPEDGGPAFPKALDPYPNVQACSTGYGSQGMSLRDWFAGQALAGLAGIAASSEASNIDEACKAMHQAAGATYYAADAMLAARKVRP